MAVVAIAGDDRVALLQRHLHADHHGLLADVEVAEAADQAHAVHLAGLLLEAADQQHVAVGGEFLVLAEIGDRGGRLAVLFAWLSSALSDGRAQRQVCCALFLATAMVLLGQVAVDRRPSIQ